MTLRIRQRIAVAITGLFMLQPMVMLRAQEHRNSHRDLVNKYYIPPKAEPNLSYSQLLALVQGKIKYVFVIYQENRSFDSYFGTFPGANGLFSQPGCTDARLYSGT